VNALFVMQRPKEKKSYITDGLPDDEIDGKYNFSVEEKLVSTKFSDLPKFYIELSGSGGMYRNHIIANCSQSVPVKEF